MKNKKNPVALLLAFALLVSTVFAAGGDAGDPLVSRDFLSGSYLSDLLSSVDGKLNSSDSAILKKARADWEKAVAAAQVTANSSYCASFKETRLKQADLLSGTIGMQIIPMAGDISVSFPSGAVIDVTTGTEVPSGSTLKTNHRYLVAEDTTAVFTVCSKTAVLNYCGTHHFTYSEWPDYNAMAGALRSLKLLRGTDTAFGSSYDLEAAPTRIQALIMLIRMLGEEDQALACTGTHPFVDVPVWENDAANKYVAYAYEKGYSNGCGQDRYGRDIFGTNIEASALMYTEFILRALGYSSTATSDISDALVRARRCGVLTSGEEALLANTRFLRADVVYLSYYALETSRADADRPLHSLLSQAGVFTDSQYHAARSTGKTDRIA